MHEREGERDGGRQARRRGDLAVTGRGRAHHFADLRILLCAERELHSRGMKKSLTGHLVIVGRGLQYVKQELRRRVLLSWWDTGSPAEVAMAMLLVVFGVCVCDCV